MRLRRVVLLLIGTTAGLVVLGAPAAGADCLGPTIEYTAGAVDRGQEITVTGTGFGDNCYDTGPPPPGEGTLGRPLADIDVVITQAGVDHVVAEGTADADYGFEVSVVVPSDLEPGEATVQALWDAGAAPASDRTDEPLVISDAPSTGEDVVATFGPDGDMSGVAPAEAPTRPASGGWGEPGRWIVAAVVALTPVGIGSMVLVRQR
jgi:hypothetical protein